MVLAGALVAGMALFLTTVRLVTERPAPSVSTTDVSAVAGGAPGESVLLPPTDAVPPGEAAPAPRSNTIRFTARQVEPSYTVVEGDSLFAIAQRFGTTAEAIQSINNLPNSSLRVGQPLIIP